MCNFAESISQIICGTSGLLLVSFSFGYILESAILYVFIALTIIATLVMLHFLYSILMYRKENVNKDRKPQTGKAALEHIIKETNTGKVRKNYWIALEMSLYIMIAHQV